MQIVNTKTFSEQNFLGWPQTFNSCVKLYNLTIIKNYNYLQSSKEQKHRVVTLRSRYERSSLNKQDKKIQGKSVKMLNSL